MTEPSPQLDYAQPPPVHHRRSFRRWIWIAAVVAVIVGTWYAVPRVADRIEVIRRERACMEYVAPPDLVAVEPDPQRGATLLTPGSDYVIRSAGIAVFVPPPAARLNGFDCVFMHGLRRPDGEKRLVFVSLIMDRNGQPRFASCVGKPATFLGGRSPVTPTLAAIPSRPYDPMPSVPRLYFGQLDAAEPSHFTIKYEYSDRTGTIDGWLKDDDSVVLEPRSEDPPPDP